MWPSWDSNLRRLHLQSDTLSTILWSLAPNIWTRPSKYPGPAVQSIVSLTSSLVVKMLTVLVSIISDSQVFFSKNVKATHIISAKLLANMPYLMIKVLTIRQLTTSLVLNNWALLIISKNCGMNDKHSSAVYDLAPHCFSNVLLCGVARLESYDGSRRRLFRDIWGHFLILSWGCKLRVLIGVALSRRDLWVHMVHHYFMENLGSSLGCPHLSPGLVLWLALGG